MHSNNLIFLRLFSSWAIYELLVVELDDIEYFDIHITFQNDNYEVRRRRNKPEFIKRGFQKVIWIEFDFPATTFNFISKIILLFQ